MDPFSFYNGGLLFSALCLCFIALVSLYSFLLLIRTKFVVPGSYGGESTTKRRLSQSIFTDIAPADIGGKLFGPWMRLAILSSIAISQIGFVAAYTIFVAQNLQAFVMAVTGCKKFLPVQYFIIFQLIIFLPLALIRSLAKLSTTALIADVFILLGLLYIFGSEFKVIAENGVADVKLFNAENFPLFIGYAAQSLRALILSYIHTKDCCILIRRHWFSSLCALLLPFGG